LGRQQVLIIFKAGSPHGLDWGLCQRPAACGSARLLLASDQIEETFTQPIKQCRQVDLQKWLQTRTQQVLRHDSKTNMLCQVDSPVQYFQLHGKRMAVLGAAV
jgi:hypothetical protein